MRRALLNRLPPYEGKKVKILEKQTVDDIIDEILAAHQDFSHHYDRIASVYQEYDIETLCCELFDLGKEIRYIVEGEHNQTTRSPAAILAMAEIQGADCKHYASLIGGILDGLCRKGRRIDWTYRFCSYDPADPIPEHVFIVVNRKGKEIWIDPVLDEIDQRYPFYFHNEDHKPMALHRIHGVGKPNYQTSVNILPDNFFQMDYCNNYGIGYAIGQSDDEGEGGFDFASLLQMASDKVKEFFTRLFGGGYQYSTGVRWLTSYYQYYVLGDGAVTSSNKVNEVYSPESQGWFALVLGVPVYDRYRLHALMGTEPSQGAPLGNSDEQRVQAYLSFPDGAAIDPKAVAQAVQIAKKFKWGTAPGSWKAFSAAAPPVNGGGTGGGSGNGNGNGGGGFFDFIKANPIESALIGAAIFFGGRELLKKRKN